MERAATAAPAPAVTARVKAAKTRELEPWGDRILMAQAIDEGFAEG